MKTTKRILACLMILAMLAAMLCIGASAATITVTNASAGTHTAYKMFSLDGDKAVVTTSDKWYPFVTTGTGASYVTLVAHPSVADTFYVYWNGGDEAAFANAAKNLNKDGFPKVETTIAAGTNDAALTVDNNGYYLVLSPATGAAPALLKVTDTGTVNEKITTVPNISKVADKVTADIGEDITYTVVVGVEADAAGDYVITDDFAGGNLDITAITVAPPTGPWNEGTDYTIDLANAKVTISEAAIDPLATNDKITITYTAKLKATATINGSNINTATLTYTDGSNTLTKTASDDVWTGKFTFTKTDGTYPLADAGFKVQNNTTSEYATFTKSGNVYTFNGWVTTENAGYEIITESNTITVQGLDAGAYTLIETTVPAGYIAPTGNTTATIAVENTDPVTGNVTAMSANDYTITNTPGKPLPETGGIGTTVFYAVGGMLVLGAVVVLLMKKRSVTE